MVLCLIKADSVTQCGITAAALAERIHYQVMYFLSCMLVSFNENECVQDSKGN